MSPARGRGQKPPTANQAPESGTSPASRAFSREDPTNAGPWDGTSLDAGARESSAVPKSRAELPQPAGGRPFEPDSIQIGAPTPVLQPMEQAVGHDFSRVRVHPDSPKASGLSPTPHRMPDPPQGGTGLRPDLMSAEPLQMKGGGPSRSAVVQFTKDNIKVDDGMTEHYADHFDADLPSSEEELIQYVFDHWDEFEQSQDEGYSDWYTLELGKFETRRNRGEPTDRYWSISLKETSGGTTYIKHYGPYGY